MRKFLPSVDEFIGKNLSSFPNLDSFPNHVITELVGSGNNGLLFRAFDESTQSNIALKVVPVSNLAVLKDDKYAYLNEAKKANLLDHPSVVKYLTVLPYEDSKRTKCVIFLCNYIRGLSLKKYVKRHASEIDIPFIESFLQTIFELLYELEERNLQHGDLHAGNIIVETPEFGINPVPTFRVTDFGVNELTGDTSHANDFLYVADTLRLLLERVKYQDCSGRDRFAFNLLRTDFQFRHLIETDATADPFAKNPVDLLQKLASIDEQYQQRVGISQSKLISPFDFPNCEQIGNSHLLLKSLYSDRLLGLSDIKKRANMVITGPRGCGKTTLFRALSLEYLTSTAGDSPDDLPYVGVYYRCDDLYFAFPRYKIPLRAEALDVPVHFFTVTLVALTLEQIAVWAKRHFPDEFSRKESSLAGDLWRSFGWNPPDNPSAHTVSSLISRLRGKERRRAARKQRHVHLESEPIEGYFGPGKLFEVCRILRSRLSFLTDRQIYFFIDDYSHPKITKALQSNLNRLVLHRSPDVFFKLSTESPVSFARDDIDGKKYVESREYDLLNLGLRYISSETKFILEFLEDLFARRFKEVDAYPVKQLRDLLGSIPRNENETARAFRDKTGQDNYAGVETVAAMCSGDIHYMIRLVGTMVEEFGGVGALTSAENKPLIPAKKQHASIRSAAGSFMESVRNLPHCGQRLCDIVTAFGNVAHSFLLYENSSNQSGSPAHQASRIEPYEAVRLSNDAQEVLNDLLRYSIFIEDPRGKSRRGRIVPRFYLRRYLVPHFRLTFSRRDSLQLENNEIELLLCEPTRFEDKLRLKSTKDAERRRRVDSRQARLFSDD
ncbi:MAG: protein kinase [Gammaproteobacteria bacterium]|nr:protein kinase [Gammaproteobacteria bacterium]